MKIPRGLREFWRFYRHERLGLVGLAIMVFLAFLAAFAPLIAPYNPFDTRAGTPFSPPDDKHPMGVDSIGSDIYSELIWGTRVSLFFGLTTAFVSTVVGSIVGLVSAYYGRWVDSVSMRAVDVLLGIPAVSLMVIMVAYLGQSIWTILLALSVTSWTRNARGVRSLVLSLKEQPFAESAKALGASNSRIMFNHILPNTLGVIVANAIITIMFAIVAEAGLAFLGLGDPNYKSWGMLLYAAQQTGAFTRGLWWWVVWPGVMILLAGCSFVFVGNAVAGYFNPRGRKWELS